MEKGSEERRTYFWKAGAVRVDEFSIHSPVGVPLALISGTTPGFLSSLSQSFSEHSTCSGSFLIGVLALPRATWLPTVLIMLLTSYVSLFLL